jgi:hypothetical protein
MLSCFDKLNMTTFSKTKPKKNRHNLTCNGQCLLSQYSILNTQYSIYTPPHAPSSRLYHLGRLRFEN